MTPLIYGPANIYRNPIWVALASDPEVLVQLQPLSHSTITSYNDLAYLQGHLPVPKNTYTTRTIVANATIAIKNAIGFPKASDLIAQLSPIDIIHLYNALMGMSITTQEQYDKLSAMLDVQFNPNFSEESWDCEICRKKGLDYTRACGYLPEDKRDPNPILPKTGAIIYTVCPISTMDYHVIGQASMAYTLLDAGILPEGQGLGNQTEWFVKAALLYKRKAVAAEKKALDEH